MKAIPKFKEIRKVAKQFLSFLPIVLPIVLILLKSVAEFPQTIRQRQLSYFLSFIGDP
jgi:H+/gluconate symporter-like permease